MVSLTHQNLPLSMFLQESDLGYPAYSGSTAKAQPDTTIIDQLGLGIVKFKEEPTPVPTPSSSTCTYRVNTDVITSVTLDTDSQINPNSPAAGMLSMNLNDYITIKGSVYDDWHIGPKLTK
jgi:hypothetical protein